jgi:aspartate racemase
VREYLHAVRDQVLGALANQDLPFEEIVGAAGVQRSPSETPLGNVFFSSYEGTLPDCRLPNLTVDVKPGLATRSAKFDWNVVVIAQPLRDGHDERITVLWEFATDLFDRESVERAQAQYLVAIRNLLDNFDRPLSAVSIIDESERRYLRAAAEGPATPYPRNANIAELLAAQAAQRPDAVAVRSGEHALTYAELDRRAAGVAGHLRAQGAGDEDTIAFLLPRGIDAVVTMLAVLKAGCAYLPLSPKDPAARIAGLLADADARLIITDDSGSRQLGGIRLPVVQYDTLLSEVSGPSFVVSGAERLAAIMFTSGSTGRPKGVEVTHRGIVRLLFGANFATFGPEERWLQLAPLSFDASTLEIWGALLHGGELVIFPDELPSAGALGEAIRKHRITMLWLNASLFNVIVDADAAVLAPLKRLLVGGEALSVPHVQRALRVLPDTTLVNGYGPTENTTFSCCYEIPRALDPHAWSVPIGSPISHSRAMLLDAQLQLTPAGAIGEIFVGGDGLARGYRNRADETSQAFVDDPFASTPDRRLYRTGDLGRLRHDGTIEFRSRRDRQLKIRGHRIEPGEIEAALCRIPGVAIASVQCDDDAVRGRSLVAFIVPSAGAALHSAGVLGAVSNDLPAYMVPDRVLIREALPTTAHGKVDAAALVGASATSETTTASWELPATVLESVVVDVFSEALGVPRIEPGVDFFSAGGHSLLVLRVLTKIERSLGVRLEPAAFFKAPTPRLLAREIERRLKNDVAGAGREAAMIRVTAGTRPLFFVPGGEGGDVSLGVYARLALHLPDHAFYGLLLASADQRIDRRHLSVQEMAASCIADLTRIHGNVRVDLVGGCVGGIVAYEMARQLEEAGHAPKKLILMDTVYPSAWQWVRSQARSWSAGVRRQTIRGLKTSGIRRSRQERIYRSISERLPVSEFEAHPAAPPEWYRFGHRIVGHKVRPLKTPVVLLATGELHRTKSVERWSGLLGPGLTVHSLPGTHWSYVRTEIAESGAILRAALDADM